MRFNGAYFIAFVVLVFIEACIALYVHDDFVRPFVGDAFVVLLLYFFLRSFLGSSYRRLPVWQAYEGGRSGAAFIKDKSLAAPRLLALGIGGCLRA